jgi:hypothetical protein
VYTNINLPNLQIILLLVIPSGRQFFHLHWSYPMDTRKNKLQVGRILEVDLNGSFGGVCNIAADSACRQLGYTNAVIPTHDIDGWGSTIIVCTVCIVGQHSFPLLLRILVLQCH